MSLQLSRKVLDSDVNDDDDNHRIKVVNWSPQRAQTSTRPPNPLQVQFSSWRRSILVRTLVSTGELSLSCAKLL